MNQGFAMWGSLETGVNGSWLDGTEQQVWSQPSRLSAKPGGREIVVSMAGQPTEVKPSIEQKSDGRLSEQQERRLPLNLSPAVGRGSDEPRAREGGEQIALGLARRHQELRRPRSEGQDANGPFRPVVRIGPPTNVLNRGKIYPDRQEQPVEGAAPSWPEAFRGEQFGDNRSPPSARAGSPSWAGAVQRQQCYRPGQAEAKRH